MNTTDVCIEPFFVGESMGDKMRKVKKTGYDAIEFWFWDHEFDGKNLVPYKKNIQEVSALCKILNMKVIDIVVNSPDGTIGGFLTRPEDREKYLERLKKTIEVAHKINCGKLITCSGNEVPGKTGQEQVDSMVHTLAKAAEIAASEDIVLVLEPLNTVIDHPGYFLSSVETALDIVQTVDHPGLKLLYDVYHMQVMKEDHLSTISNNIHLIGHFHAASAPGRNEIYRGEVDFRTILETIGIAGYDGYFGLEYWPSEEETVSLSKTREYLAKISGKAIA